MDYNEDKCIVMKGRPKIFCRWWVKSRKIPQTYVVENGKIFACASTELYIPWYSWPLELFHRLLFGSTKLKMTDK